MRRNCCHLSFASILKFLNFLQAFFGVSILIYAIWMLDQWNHRAPVAPPPLAPSPESSAAVSMFVSGSGATGASDRVDFAAASLFSGLDDGLGFDLHSLKLPAPWFIYSFMGIGILVCCVTLIGYIAAEAINGCCLCFYAVLTIVLILLEAALVAFIAIDHHWEKDLPVDPTGELDSLRSFIENNIDLCKWFGIAAVTIQALSLLLAIVLRAMVSTRRSDLDDEDDFESGVARTREPLLNHQANQASGSSKVDGWSSRMRQKYGLN